MAGILKSSGRPMFELLYTTYAIVAILPYVGIVACIKVGAL